MANSRNSVMPEDVSIPMKDATVGQITGFSKKSSSVLSFHDIQYEVTTREGCCASCKKGTQRKILQDVYGLAKPGLNAIMGPTGSGKSSLLDILAGRKDPSGLTGTVLLNGRPIPDNWKNISGYVVQNDVVLGTLTVRENFWFSANLRLSRKIPKIEKEEKIENILTELGLTVCADTKVGTDLIRGISGGEKKRTNIGMELITSPDVLFLDEPTTGLDASTANAVMNLLKRLALNNRTIILSIHQPRFSIFRLFDSLTLLCLGKVAYHGPSPQALDFFRNQGYVCEEFNNPADFFLDVINGDSTALQNGQLVAKESSSQDLDGNGLSIAEELANSYSKSEIYKNNMAELLAIEQANDGSKAVTTSGSMYSTSFMYQLYVLSDRAFKNVIRNPMAAVGNLVLNLIIGVLFGLFYLQVDNSFNPGVQNRLGVLFFITTNLLFGSINTVEIFVNEREIFIHEYVSGYYRIISYFLAKLFADLIPMRTIAPIIFCTVTYWMVGLKPTAAAFFFFLLVCLLTAYASVAIGLFYSASFDTFGVASLFLSLTYVFSIIFSGLLVNIDSITPVLRWLQWFSIARYSFFALCINEFSGEYYSTCPNITRTEPNGPDDPCFVSGDDILTSQLGMPNDTAWDIWQNIVALGAIALGMFVLTYIQLTRIKTLT